MAGGRPGQGDRRLEREAAACEKLRLLEMRVRAYESPGSNPLPRAAFLLVFFCELGVRWLLGQEDDGAWTQPLLHGFLAWAGVAFFCRAVEALHKRLCGVGKAKGPV